MELKTKYQYTYFIYPYIIKQKNYETYLQKLLNNKNCKLKIFEKERNMNIYTYFLPNVRKYLFWTLDLEKSKIKKLEELDNISKPIILAKNPCTIFEYQLEKNIQGKMDDKNGIYFDIAKIEIICFQTGICFITLKTTVEGTNNFEDVLNFNYKFRDINSELSTLKEYENIKLQSDSLGSVENLSKLIENLAGRNNGIKELNIDKQRFYIYTYTCLDGEEWKEEQDFEKIKSDFSKYCNIKPSNYNVEDSGEGILNRIKVVSDWNYAKYGISKTATSLITSGINSSNYTKLPFKYENEYLYTYIFILYQKIILKKISKEFKKINQFKQVRKKFIDFVKELWTQEITNDENGEKLIKEWKIALKLEENYQKLKSEYDVLYKDYNIEGVKKANKLIIFILVITLFINIIGLLKLME